MNIIENGICRYILLTSSNLNFSCKITKMSAEQDTSSDENINDQDRRTQTDSIHERFRAVDYVYCEDCKGKIESNSTSIQKHYEDKSHPSSRSCRYCKGKVFIYQNIVNEDNNDKSLNRTYIFHKCKNL